MSDAPARQPSSANERSSPSLRCPSSSPDANGWARCDVAAARPGNSTRSIGCHDPSAAVSWFAAVGEPRPSPARRVPEPATSDGVSPNRRQRVNKDRARRPDTASVGPSARRSCPRPSVDYRDPMRTGDPSDSGQSGEHDDCWKPAASACANERADQLRASVEPLGVDHTHTPWPPTRP